MTAGMEHRIETLEANGAKAADAAAQTLSATKAEGEAALNKAMEAAEAVMTSLEVWMDKRAFLLSHFDLAKNDHFAKTGWGLTQGKAGKEVRFCRQAGLRRSGLRTWWRTWKRRRSLLTGCENVLLAPFL